MHWFTRSWLIKYLYWLYYNIKIGNLPELGIRIKMFCLNLLHNLQEWIKCFPQPGNILFEIMYWDKVIWQIKKIRLLQGCKLQGYNLNRVAFWDYNKQLSGTVRMQPQKSGHYIRHFSFNFKLRMFMAWPFIDRL